MEEKRDSCGSRGGDREPGMMVEGQEKKSKESRVPAQGRGGADV